MLDKNKVEALQSAIEEGTIKIDLDSITQAYEMKQTRELLKKYHHYKAYKGSDGNWYAYYDEEEGGVTKQKRIRRKTEEEIEKALLDIYKDKIEADIPTIESVFEEWLSDKIGCKELLPQSIAKYRAEFKRFFKNNKDAKEILNTPIRKISDESLKVFIKSSIVDLKLSSKAFADMKIILRGIFKYAKDQEYTDFSITNFLGDLQISSRAFTRKQVTIEESVFSEEETTKIVEYLEDKQDIRDMAILLLFHSGLRIGELSALKRKDVEAAPRIIKISRTEVNYKGKSGKNEIHIQDMAKTDAGNREVVINSECEQLIKRILKKCTGEYLFMENGKRITSQGHRKHLYSICDKLGIVKKSPHKIRRTYGTMLIDSGIDDGMVCDQMGHKEIGTAKRYYYYSRRNKQKKMDAIEKAIALKV